MIYRFRSIILLLLPFILFSCLNNDKSDKTVNSTEPENPYLVKGFGVNGLTGYSNNLYSEFKFSDMVLDSSGNIYAVGNSNGLKMYLNKYLPDGKPDSTFGDNGIVVIDGCGNASTLDKDGNIIIAGYSCNPEIQMTIWKFFPNGKPDTSFGVSGTAVHEEEGINSDGLDIAADLSGDLYIAGYRQPGSNSTMTIWKYSLSGIIDTTFGNNGIVNYGDPSKYSCLGKRIKFDSAGNLVITGGNDGYVAVWKYSPSGIPDLTFNNSGVVSFYTRGCGIDLTLDNLDNILITGTDYDGSNGYKMIILKYDKNGSPDKSFGPYNWGVADFKEGRSIGYSIILDNNGRIVIGGQNGGSAAIWCYTASGLLDTSLNGSGFLTYDNPGDEYFAYSGCFRILFDSKGNLFLAGYNHGQFDVTEKMTIWKYSLP